MFDFPFKKIQGKSYLGATSVRRSVTVRLEASGI
jgi:hypothetical protein